jgi:D-alanyl-D-alanine dipeptidase
MTIFKWAFIFFSQSSLAANLPADFVELKKIDPTIIQEMRLAGDHNFVGKPIPGYNAPKCILTKKAALALAEIQKEVKAKNMSLKVYDCYRPQKAVDALLKWAKDAKDIKMKEEFYPNIDKSKLFETGFLATKSSHCRGSAADVTLVPLPVAPQKSFDPKLPLKSCALPKDERFDDNSIDMGTGYDCFDKSSYSDSFMPFTQKANRQLLISLMQNHGFQNLKSEWWHFTLKDEPHPDTYFDFEIK